MVKSPACNADLGRCISIGGLSLSSSGFFGVCVKPRNSAAGSKAAILLDSPRPIGGEGGLSSAFL